MPYSKEVIESWLEALNEPKVQRRLSKWEQDFVESIGGQWVERGRLSEKQEEVLERIYADKT